MARNATRHDGGVVRPNLLCQVLSPGPGLGTAVFRGHITGHEDLPTKVLATKRSRFSYQIGLSSRVFRSCQEGGV